MRGRIDWKYALALSLTDPGFDSTVLSEFRTRLVEGGAEHGLLDAVLTIPLVLLALLVKVLKFLLFVALALFVVGLVRGWMARRSV